MNYDKRFFQIWSKTLGTVILALGAFFGTMYVITQLPAMIGLLLLAFFIAGYVGWFTFSVAKFKREAEVRSNEHLMETIKKESTV
jgi:hypothetical protein